MLLKLDKTKFKVGDFIVGPIDFELKKGEYCVIIGYTGAGKSSFIKGILGVIPQIEGKLLYNGEKLYNVGVEKRGFGYLPQHFALFPHFNVYKNIAYGVLKRIKDKKVIDKRVKYLAKELNIEHILYRSIKNLSGGEKQRVALGRALAIEPKLLIVDEPFSAVDPSTKHKLSLLLKKIVQKLGIGVLHITHNLDEAYSLGDKIAVFEDGKIVQQGKKGDIFYNPIKESVAKLLNYRNIFHGVSEKIDQNRYKVVTNCGYTLNINKKGVKEGDISGCIRPNDIKIIDSDNKDIKKQLKNNIFSGVIVSTLHYPDRVTILFKTDNYGGYYNFEITFPNFIYKRLKLEGKKEISVAPWEENIIFF